MKKAERARIQIAENLIPNFNEIWDKYHKHWRKYHSMEYSNYKPPSDDILLEQFLLDCDLEILETFLLDPAESELLEVNEDLDLSEIYDKIRYTQSLTNTQHNK